MQLPSVDVLHGFVTAAQTLNFRRAARQIALTPAALGRRIQVLEELCGTPLFQRTTRQVALTEAGRQLLPRAREALATVEGCIVAARGPAHPVQLDLVIGTRHDLGLSWLFPQIQRLAADLPHVTVHLFFGATDDLFARLRTREIDCAVTSARFTDPELDAIALLREDLVFVAAPALLRRQPLTRAEHARHHVLIDASADLPLFRYWRDAEGGGDLPFARVVRVQQPGGDPRHRARRAGRRRPAPLRGHAVAGAWPAAPAVPARHAAPRLLPAGVPAHRRPRRNLPGALGGDEAAAAEMTALEQRHGVHQGGESEPTPPSQVRYRSPQRRTHRRLSCSAGATPTEIG